MNMTNKSLALLLVAAIVISVAGTMISLNKLNEIKVVPVQRLTGRALTGSGQVNLTITSNASCTADSNVDFGSDAPSSVITISTDYNNQLTTNFTDCSSDGVCSGIVANNTGNAVINITFNSTKNGTNFIGGDETHFLYLIDQTETDADGCITPGSVSWANVPMANTLACGNLSYTPGNDTITMEFNVTLNSSTTTGVKTTTVNLYCVAS